MPIASLFPTLPEGAILYEDDDLVAIDKPPFVATHAPDTGRLSGTVNIERPIDVHVMRRHRIGNGPRNRWNGSQMVNHLGTGKDPRQFVVFPDINQVGFDPVLHLFDIGQFPAVQVIDNGNAVFAAAE